MVELVGSVRGICVLVVGMVPVFGIVVFAVGGAVARGSGGSGLIEEAKGLNSNIWNFAENNFYFSGCVSSINFYLPAVAVVPVAGVGSCDGFGWGGFLCSEVGAGVVGAFGL